MAYTGHQYSGVRLQKGVAGKLYFVVGTAEAQVMTASKNGGAFAAVNAGTTAAVVGGTGPTTLFLLTVNKADAATLGRIVFLATGATSTQTVEAEVVDFNPYSEGAMTDKALSFRAVQR